MGLMDVINGMQNGPHGPRSRSGQSQSQSGGGMSPITMAVLGLLAYKALKALTSSQPGAHPATPAPTPLPRQTAPSDESADAGGNIGDIIKGGLGGLLKGGAASSGTTASAGNLGDLLKGGLGGLLAGGAAGSVLSGGLNDVLKQLQDAGHGGAADSWVGQGPNKSIEPDDLGKALGADQISTLMAHSGLSRDDLLSALSQHLPDLVNELTPQGRLPTESEIARLVQ